MNQRKPKPLFMLALVCTGLWGGCTYDLDRLERAAAERDAGSSSSDGGVPEQLIDLFREAPFYSDTCRRCALDRCAQANADCHDDEQCAAVTACFSRSNDPRNHAECRAQYRDWFQAHMSDIDVGGPFYDCVFWRNCSNECDVVEDMQCIGDFTWPATGKGATIPLSMVLQEALMLTPSAGAVAKVCRIEDLQCNRPSMMDVADEEGRVDLELPAPLGEFTGYIEITGAELAPTLVAFGWPVAMGDARRMPIVSATTLALQQLAGDVPTVDGTGLVQARVFGCSGIGTRNINVDVEPRMEETDTWYFDGQLPDFDVDVTYDNGNAGVINVPPGLVELVGTRIPQDEVVLRWTIPIRPDHLTILIGSPAER